MPANLESFAVIYAFAMFIFVVVSMFCQDMNDIALEVLQALLAPSTVCLSFCMYSVRSPGVKCSNGLAACSG